MAMATANDKARGAKEEEESARRRMRELEGLIADGDDPSVVERSRAHMELAALRKRLGVRTTLTAAARLSVTALRGRSTNFVAQRAASMEVAIERERRRAEREEEILRIRAEIGRVNRGDPREEERRTELEGRLEAAESAIEAMDAEDASHDVPEPHVVENEEGGDEGNSAAVDAVGVGGADGEAVGTGSEPSETERAMDDIFLPLCEDDEDKITPGTISATSSEGESPSTTEDADSLDPTPRDPGEGGGRGEDPADDRIRLLEEQIQRWRQKAEDLSARCEHLEEEGRAREEEIETLGNAVPAAPCETPRDSERDEDEGTEGAPPRRPPSDPVEEFLSETLSYRTEDDLEALGDRGQFAHLSKLECSSTPCPWAGSLLMYRLSMKNDGAEHCGFLLYPSGCDPFLLGKIFGIISNDGAELLITFPGHSPLETETEHGTAPQSQSPSLSIRNTFGASSMVPLMIAADLPSGVDPSSAVGRPSLVYSRCGTRSMLHFALLEPAPSARRTSDRSGKGATNV